MNQKEYQNHLNILKHELKVALGCTEPIAIAYAGALARQILGQMPQSCQVRCSGNIIKNVKGVVVPNSDGLRGIEVAATLGIVGGDPSRELAVLESITAEHRIQVQTLLKEHFCHCTLVEGVENLFIVVEVFAGEESALVEIQQYHRNITKIMKNGVILQESSGDHPTASEPLVEKEHINLQSILDFADALVLEDLQQELSQQFNYNIKISQEGLQSPWGVQAGKTILSQEQEPSLHLRARAAAAAGSDARMNGCALPVVINSGSGNQGITLTMPIHVYGEAYHIPQEVRYRGLALANLLAVHQKKYIGQLSAYCGVVSAATASACGIAYMLLHSPQEQHRRYQVMSDTITNSICTIGGMVCDGAKSSCATKINVAVEAALTALDLALEQRVFQPGEGMTMEEVEQTIQAVGRMGKQGMSGTDLEIIRIMLGQ